MNEIKAIIWDIDKTLYPFDEAFGVASQKALAGMMMDLKLGFTAPQALAYAEPTYPMKTIAKLQAQFGLGIEEMFYSYYNNLSEDFLRPAPDFLQQIHSATVIFGVLSHSNRHWTDRALSKLGLAHYIPKKFRVTSDELAGKNKDEGVEAFYEILGRMNIPPHQAMMIEDKDKNLEFAHKIGMTTVFVTNGDQIGTAKHADYVYETGHEFMRAFNRRAQQSRTQTAPPSPAPLTLTL